MTLAELRDDILARHVGAYVRGDDSETACTGCGDDWWPCDAVRLASLLTVERVAAGLVEIDIQAVGDTVEEWWRKGPMPLAADLLDAVEEDEQ